MNRKNVPVIWLYGFWGCQSQTPNIFYKNYPCQSNSSLSIPSPSPSSVASTSMSSISKTQAYFSWQTTQVLEFTSGRFWNNWPTSVVARETCSVPLTLLSCQCSWYLFYSRYVVIIQFSPLPRGLHPTSPWKPTPPPPPLGTQHRAWGPGQGYLYRERRQRPTREASYISMWGQDTISTRYGLS